MTPLSMGSSAPRRAGHRVNYVRPGATGEGEGEGEGEEEEEVAGGGGGRVKLHLRTRATPRAQLFHSLWIIISLDILLSSYPVLRPRENRGRIVRESGQRESLRWRTENRPENA